MQTRTVSFYQECLTRGPLLSREEKVALFKYLLQSKKKIYLADAKELLQKGQICRSIANGEIKYTVSENVVTYQPRANDETEFIMEVRQQSLGFIQPLRLIRLQKFFAQSEVDAIRNYPLPGKSLEPMSGYGINQYPYYSLKFYANGRNRLIGLINKLQLNDKEFLTKLRTF